MGLFGRARKDSEKAVHEEKLDEKVFEQIARYNLSMKVDYLWVTNGKFNFCCKLKEGIELMREVPSVEEISDK